MRAQSSNVEGDPGEIEVLAGQLRNGAARGQHARLVVRSAVARKGRTEDASSRRQADLQQKLPIS